MGTQALKPRHAVFRERIIAIDTFFRAQTLDFFDVLVTVGFQPFEFAAPGDIQSTHDRLRQLQLQQGSLSEHRKEIQPALQEVSALLPPVYRY
jgi:hypothetical protein